MLVDAEGIVSLAEDAAALARGNEPCGGRDHFRQCNKRRQMTPGRSEFAQDGADVRESRSIARRSFRLRALLVAGEHPMRAGGMIVIRMSDGADEADFIGLPRQMGKMLADLDAGHFGANGREFTPDLRPAPPVSYRRDRYVMGHPTYRASGTAWLCRTCRRRQIRRAAAAESNEGSVNPSGRIAPILSMARRVSRPPNRAGAPLIWNMDVSLERRGPAVEFEPRNRNRTNRMETVELSN